MHGRLPQRKVGNCWVFARMYRTVFVLFGWDVLLSLDTSAGGVTGMYMSSCHTSGAPEEYAALQRAALEVLTVIYYGNCEGVSFTLCHRCISQD